MSTKTFEIDVMCQLIRFDEQSCAIELDPWVEFIPEEWRWRVQEILEHSPKSMEQILADHPKFTPSTMRSVCYAIRKLLFDNGIDPKEPPLPKELTRPAERKLLLHEQPKMGQRIKVWRKGELLFGGPLTVTHGEWGTIWWSDGTTKIAPYLMDEWEPD